MSDLRTLAIDWRAATHAAVCDRIEPWAHGVAVRATQAPGYYDYNAVRLEGPDPGISFEDALAELDRIQAGLDHRKLEVEDLHAGERLRPRFAELGWDNSRLLWMVHDGVRPEVPGGVDLQEVPADAIRHLRLEWTDRFTPEEIAAFIPVEDAVFARLGGVNLAVMEDGRAIAYARVTTLRGTSEIVNVFVTESRRGGGLGGALTSWAVAGALDAGAEHVLIIADDEDRPKQLYARLGFQPAWIQHEFTRRPAQADSTRRPPA